jgi:dTDP-4-dehydrorhamnose reductase
MILITGSKGQLGIALQRLFDREGKKYHPVDVQELNIADFSAVREMMCSINPTLVINCAAFNDVDGAEKNWQTAMDVNARGVQNLAVCCEEKSIPIVHIGTDFVFDGTSDRPYTIADEPNPINMYGKSKLVGERFVMSLTRKYWMIRTSWVFGEGTSNFLYKLFQWSKGKTSLKVVTDQISSPTYAPDLANVIWKLVNEAPFGLYHFRNSNLCSRYEWAEFALREIGWTGTLEPVTTDHFPAPAKRPTYSVLDLYPLTELGFEVPTWQDATKRFISEFLK